VAASVKSVPAPSRPSMRVALLALAAIALSGCASSGPTDYTCPEANTWARIDRIEGDTLHVVLIDFSQATLHTKGADMLVLVNGEECLEAARSGLRQGLEISVQVDAWQESQPPQADVAFVIQRG
jgi:type IV pilus biogenesis protein CpaD/CtpE